MAKKHGNVGKRKTCSLCGGLHTVKVCGLALNTVDRQRENRRYPHKVLLWITCNETHVQIWKWPPRRHKTLGFQGEILQNLALDTWWGPTAIPGECRAVQMTWRGVDGENGAI